MDFHDDGDSKRPWGRYEILSEAERYKVKKVIVNPGHRLSLQRHRRRSEHWIIVSGEALITLGDETIDLNEGETIDIGVGEIHRIENRGGEILIFIEVQFGDYFGEDDIERLQDDYARND
jgi:mannose-6-phosphate isomerase-like protein (cupin superfamily)